MSSKPGREAGVAGEPLARVLTDRVPQPCPRFDHLVIPEDLARVLERFVSEFPRVTEIWVFGSRADGTASDDSDWDLLVRSDDHLTAAAVRPAQHFRSERFCLFIAHGDSFERPWPRAHDGLTETGSFPDWRWTWEGDRARYHGSSLKPGRRTGEKSAVRIWMRT